MTMTGGRAARRASALALGLLAAASAAGAPAVELPSRARDVHQADSHHPNENRQPQLRQTGPRRHGHRPGRRRHGSRRLKKDGEAAPFDPSDGVRRPTLLQHAYDPAAHAVHPPKSDKARFEDGSGYGDDYGSGYGHGGSKSSKSSKGGKSGKSSKGGKGSKRGKSAKAGGYHGGPYGGGYPSGYPSGLGGGGAPGDVWLDGPEDSFLVVDEAGGDGAGDEGGSGAEGGDADVVGDAVDGTGQDLEFLLDEGSAGGSLPSTEDGSDGGSGADGTAGTDGGGPSGWSNDATLDALLDAAADVATGLNALLDAADSEGPAALAPAAREEAIVAKCGRSSLDRSWSLIHLLGDFAPDEEGEPTASLVAQEGPWYDAYVWLTHLDGAILCPPEDIVDGASEDGGVAMEAREAREAAVGRIRQRYALATLYFAMGGDDWNECAAGRRWFDEDAGAGAGGCPDGEGRWLDASHECTWYNVSCDVAEGTVTKIDLTGNGLEGEVPFGALALLEAGGLVSYLRVSKTPTSPPAP